MEHEICVGGTTALSCWREARIRVAESNASSPYDPNPRPLLVRMLFEGTDDLDLSALPVKTDITRLPRTVYSEDAAWLSDQLPHVLRPLVCCVASDAGRRFLTNAKTCILSGGFPEGSIYIERHGIWLPSPELLALLLCRSLPVGAALMAMAELGGYHAIGLEGLLVAAPPVTSSTAVGDYLERLRLYRADLGQRMPRGSSRASPLAALAIDGAASPAEAVLAYLLCLPREMGGYGLPRPELNRRIAVDNEVYVCDLSWNEGSCLLEYQGGAHLSAGRAAADMRKGNALRASGRTLLEAGRSELMSISGMDRLAGLLAGALGACVAPWSAEERALQVKLRTELFSAGLSA